MIFTVFLDSDAFGYEELGSYDTLEEAEISRVRVQADAVHYYREDQIERKVGILIWEGED